MNFSPQAFLPFLKTVQLRWNAVRLFFWHQPLLQTVPIEDQEQHSNLFAKGARTLKTVLLINPWHDPKICSHLQMNQK